MSFQRVAERDSLWSGEMRSVAIADPAGRPLRVVLIDHEGTVHAYVDRCVHQGVELSRGTLEGHTLTCAAHAWCYDVRTGEGINPRGVRLRALAVKIEDGGVLVDLHGARGG